MIIFPRDENTRYYKTHYMYLLNIIKRCVKAPSSLKLGPPTGFNGSKFIIDWNEKKVLIDFCDLHDLPYDPSEYDTIFKYHWNQEIFSKHENLFPIMPMSFFDWDQYSILQEQIKYTCNGNRILCNQRPYAGALERRRKVQALLKEHFQEVDTRIYPQEHFWGLINDCLLSVCVPGARNDILDRGQLQQMAFGCCTISPRLSDEFQESMEGTYIECAEDYSDLVPIIKGCISNRHACKWVGERAKKWFQTIGLPNQIFKWMETCING